uniref:Cytochrome c oxidase subunit 3 n=1 Tax=Virgulibracon endoxylaphagus TaxID=2933211 RepID=A0A8T9JDJ9_9HYME|nr:cytochrome c oxidase subunit III [Virgulibracon endoxylaphagus]UOK09629.1 cytochrome c oxidase subunit III [Virgulibracon endoxylaphagus]
MNMNMNKLYLPFHLVTLSPWPLLMSISFMIFLIGNIKLFTIYSSNLLMLSYFLMLMNLFQWWRDVIRESTFQGNHTILVMKGLRLGMIFFIISEIMFFFSFFWCYFSNFLSPSIEIGMIWPPLNILVFNPLNIPLLNTLILLSSGVFITWCHYSILNKNYLESKFSILMTLFLGILFIMFQFMEYKNSFFTISDSIYGSIFFMMTGFHGFHVILGILFILFSMIRLFKFHYSNFHHLGFELSSWYWHFVDVIWLFLYIFVYWLSY